MRRVFLLIDGYNLMHAAGFARYRYGPGDLQRCRQRFLTELTSRLQQEALPDSLVIFDAFESPDDTDRTMVVNGLTVNFAEPGGDADSEIEEIIRTHSAPRQVLVVSSDHRLHKAARRRRCRCVDSAVFWRQIDPDNSQNAPMRRKPPDSRPMPVTSEVNEHDSMEWPEVFDFDEADLSIEGLLRSPRETQQRPPSSTIDNSPGDDHIPLSERISQADEIEQQFLSLDIDAIQREVLREEEQRWRQEKR
ncbi:MAG: NYN domain-containing protein [Planctomycetaceae bacterium]|nr:NYN domain-containing protein [Planctomycetaceae bacterium]